MEYYMLKSISRMKNYLSKFYNQQKIHTLFPAGHFYSPIVNPKEIKEREGLLWNTTDKMVGIDMHVDEQLALLQALTPYISHINYPQEQPLNSQTTYFYKNDQYPMLDAEFLFSFLCHSKPKHMIEVGSGFSSLVTADVNRRILGQSLDFICVEPYPRQFLIDGVDGISRLICSKVEDLPLTFFDILDTGDILFIDSSHVSKTGSDVNYIFFNILPLLKKGVFVHIHDIFLPDEYPKRWVIEECRNWNEQYILRAFLSFNTDWKIIWMAHYMGLHHTNAVQKAFPRFPNGAGGSFWIERI